MLVNISINEAPWRIEVDFTNLEWEHDSGRYEYYSLPQFGRNFGYTVKVNNRKMDFGFKGMVTVEDGARVRFEKQFDDAELAMTWCTEMVFKAERMSDGLNKSETGKLLSRWNESGEIE